MQWPLPGRSLSLSTYRVYTESPGKEALNGRIELKKHEPHLIHRMLQHLYMIDYSASEIEVNGKKEKAFVSELHTHVMMYAVGDEYDMKDLKEEALWKLKKATEAKEGQHHELMSVLEVVPAIYKTTPYSNRGLRDVVVAFGVKHLESMMDLSEFTQTSDYMVDVWLQHFEKLDEEHRMDRWS